MFTKLIYPIFLSVGLALSIPCVISRSFAPLLSKLNLIFFYFKDLNVFF